MKNNLENAWKITQIVVLLWCARKDKYKLCPREKKI